MRLNGILVGYIGSVQLSGSRDPKRTVEIDMMIQNKYLDQIPDDSKAAISAANLLGDKYINITKGTHPKHVQPGGEIAALQTQDIPEILAQSSSLLQQFQTILGRVDGLLADRRKRPGQYRQADQGRYALRPLNATAGEVEQLVKDVKNSNGTISHLLYDDDALQRYRGRSSASTTCWRSCSRARARPGKLLYDPALVR